MCKTREGYNYSIKCINVVCISIDETKAAISLYLKFCRSSPTPPTLANNQAYGSAYGPPTTYNEAYGPMTTYNEAYGPITTYNQAYGPMTIYSEAYDHIDPEYAVVDNIQDCAPPRPSPIPAMESKDQTSSPDHPGTD